MLALMWSPGLAGIATRLIYQRDLRGSGWGWGASRYQLASYLIPVLAGLLVYVLAWSSGIANFDAKPGQWWVTARWELAFEDLYWNIPFDLSKEAPAQVRLTLANAVRRPKL